MATFDGYHFRISLAFSFSNEEPTAKLCHIRATLMGQKKRDRTFFSDSDRKS